MNLPGVNLSVFSTTIYNALPINCMTIWSLFLFLFIFSMFCAGDGNSHKLIGKFLTHSTEKEIKTTTKRVEFALHRSPICYQTPDRKHFVDILCSERFCMYVTSIENNLQKDLNERRNTILFSFLATGTYYTSMYKHIPDSSVNAVTNS